MDIQNISIGADPNLLIEEGIYNIVNDATVHENHPSITEGGLLVVKNGSNSKLTQTFIGSWGVYTRSGTFSTAWARADWKLNGVEDPTVPSEASEIAYDNDTSLLVADDVQTAIDEVVEGLNGKGDMSAATYDPNEVGDDAFDCANHAYDPTTSGLTATTVQAAIDELKTLVGGV